MRVNELADKLRARGLTVVEVAGWQTRGNEYPTRPDGAVRHWTAGPATGDTPCLNIVTHGRSDVPGPLCNTYQSRRVDANGLDIVYVIASGKSNNAGRGGWNGMTSNYDVLGLEIEWSGPNEAFANVRKRKLTSELIMRAMMDCTAGTNDNDACEHREWAPTRKIDTNLSGDELRRRMAELRNATTPTDPGEEEEMAQLVWYKGATGPHCYYNVGMFNKHCTTMDTVNLLKFLGVKEANTSSNPLTGAWLDTAVFVDGPLRNTPNDVNLTAIAKAVDGQIGDEALATMINDLATKVAAIGSVGGDGDGSVSDETVEAVRKVILEEFGFLKPGQ